jgi:NadR type nicotinamide-nucleotide adenylyltransferase
LPANNSLFSSGLVVGKFSPLHRGHELLIQTARSECLRLLIISYSVPELPQCSRKRRAGWLNKRFPDIEAYVLDQAELDRLAKLLGIVAPTIPDNNAPDDDHRRFCGWVCQYVASRTIDVVFTSEDYGDGFAQVLTNYFRDFSPTAKQVTHRCVDKNRFDVPISGTQIRKNLYQYRDFLASEVYADLVKKVLLLGGESTGKTTLAQALAKALNTQWVSEYGRELWDAKQGKLEFDDMLHIANTQIEREDHFATEANGWLICDTSPLTTLLYSHAMFDRAAPELIDLACRQYDRVLLCAPDFEFIQDGTRRDDAFRQYQHDWYERELTKRQIPFSVLEGSLEERLITGLSTLSQ